MLKCAFSLRGTELVWFWGDGLVTACKVDMQHSLIMISCADFVMLGEVLRHLPLLQPFKLFFRGTAFHNTHRHTAISYEVHCLPRNCPEMNSALHVNEVLLRSKNT